MWHLPDVALICKIAITVTTSPITITITITVAITITIVLESKSAPKQSNWQSQHMSSSSFATSGERHIG